MKKHMLAISAITAFAVLMTACAELNPQPAATAAVSPKASNSPSPSAKPTATVSPSPAATKTPTEKPSEKPTAKPSASPSPSPSATAKPAQTAKPTGAPAASGDKKAVSWYYMKKKKGQVPDFPAETKKMKPEQKVIYVGTGKKVYLTIDTGGPLGDVDKMLKALKDNDAKANFFVAGYNIKKDPEFLKRLVKDGHLVANHTMTHKDMTEMTDEQVKKEIEDYEKLYKEITGKEIVKYFRFPYGKYSPHLLDVISGMGYSSVFWSTAMRDWEPRKNGADDPYNDIMNNLHDGNVILMHQGSEENIEALDRIIKAIKKEGYELALLSDM